MKKGFKILLALTLIAVLALPNTFSVLANNDNSVNVKQGYTKLPDNLDYIKNEVLIGISKNKDQLQDEVNQKSNGASIKENVLVNRLDDKKILAEDDNELILIYEVQYSCEGGVNKSPITNDYKIDSAYYAYNNLVVNLSARLNYHTDWDYNNQGCYPREIYETRYSWSSANTYNNYMLCVDSIDWHVAQAGVPYGGSSFLPLYEGGTHTFDPIITLSGTYARYHYPSNWTLMLDGLSVGYGVAVGDFDIICYHTVSPYDYFSVGEQNRQVTIGSPMPV